VHGQLDTRELLGMARRRDRTASSTWLSAPAPPTSRSR